MLVYEYKLDGNQKQFAAIEEAIRTVQFIRNRCIRLWVDGERVSKNDLQTYCAILAKEYPFASCLNSQARQASADRAWFAISKFYENCREHKPGKKGYPQFQHNNRSVEYKQTGWKLDDDSKHITFTDGCGIGRLRLVGNKKQKIETFPVKDIKRVRIVRRADGYYCQFCVKTERKVEHVPTGRELGIDVGLKSFLTDSEGNTVDNPRHYRKADVHSRLYRGALGNRRTCSVKRFWTGDLYCLYRKGRWQAPWMKEEPPGFLQGSISISCSCKRSKYEPRPAERTPQDTGTTACGVSTD
jgi:putative transposase